MTDPNGAPTMAPGTASIPTHVPRDRVIDFDVFSPPGSQADYFGAWMRLLNGPDLVWTTANGGHWIAAGGSTVRGIWEDAMRFSNEALAVTPGLGEVMQFIPLQQDAPEHKPFRSAVMKGFAHQYIVATEPLVRDETIRLIEAMRADGGCDFMAEFAEILPVHTFLSVIGLPPEDRVRLRPLGRQLTRPDGSMTVVDLRDAADAYLEPYIRERLANPGSDLFSRILSVPIKGRAWTFEESQRMCRNLLFGGLDTVVAMLGNIMMYLARHPAEQEELREAPGMIPDAADELMRRYPTVAVTRNCVETCEIDGVTIERGDLVYLPSVLHNLDPRSFETPEKVDFARKLTQVRHSTMGAGTHRCVGAALARMEVIVVMEEWLARMPAFALAEGAQTTFRAGNVGALDQLALNWQT